MRQLERWVGLIIIVLFALVLGTGISSSLSHEPGLHGAGATFPAPLYSRWIALFEKQHAHIEIEYEAIGSGGGIDAITSQEVHFGASDALMNEEEIESAPGEIIQIPMVLGPVVIAYNLPDLDAQLTLDGDTIADIYLGKITRWNDEAIVALNPDINLPDNPIRVAHRADSSGTSYIFTDYLSAVSSEWASEVGRGKVVDWVVSQGAGEGNDGVAQQILLQPGGIGYLEIKYADNAGLDYAILINRAGEAVLPTVANVQAAESNTPAVEGEFTKESIVNAPGADSYPIAGFTYMLVYCDLGYFDNPELAETLVEYLEWTLTEGQVVAPELKYTPLPEELREEALHRVEMIAEGDC